MLRKSSVYIQSNEIHNVVALIKFLLALRCQLYTFRTVTVHPQELLVDTVYADYGKKCTIRYVQLVRRTSWTYRIVRLLPRTIVCTYSIYKKLLRMDRYGPKHVELTPKC